MDSVSSSEVSTVDLANSEDLLKQIPEFSEDFKTPEQCFPEGKTLMVSLLGSEKSKKSTCFSGDAEPAGSDYFQLILVI